VSCSRCLEGADAQQAEEGNCQRLPLCILIEGEPDPATPKVVAL